ncbi:MAG: leucine-rich repeat domain-containing protein, partial [Clostridia bacterium]|nr:leucine-rich repeat domain-containing protein [Clostridia bacterium]
IGANAFQNTSVTLIGFSDAVTRIDENAFSGCDCLSAVYYGGTEDAFNRIATAYGNLPLLNADLYPLYGFYGAFPITHTTDPGVQDVFWGS